VAVSTSVDTNNPTHYLSHGPPLFNVLLSCFKTVHRYGVLQRIGGQEIPSIASSTNSDVEKRPVMTRTGVAARFRLRILIMGVLVSLGGFIFGYDTGQISGFLEMPDFLARFVDTANPKTDALAFSNGRSGAIVALLSIGTLLGALYAVPAADKHGRKPSIVFWCIVFCVGVIVQVTTEHKWYQVAPGSMGCRSRCWRTVSSYANVSE
jgi:SP family sugar:H+ symporter-like MFS transporter